MEFPNVSKFGFAVKSTNAKPPKTLEPEMTLVGGIKGKFKLNEAASKLLGLYPTDYLVFVSNEEEVAAAVQANDPSILEWAEETGNAPKDFPVSWGIAKGWAELDMNGNAIKSKKPLTKFEEEELIANGAVDENGKAVAPIIDRVKGSRLSTKSTEVKLGMILEGTDGTNCPLLRKNVSDDKHAVYAINPEPVTVEFPNGNSTVEVDVYTISFAREDDKIERG